MELKDIKAVFDSHPKEDVVFVAAGMPFVGERGKNEAHNYAVKQGVEVVTYKREDVLKELDAKSKDDISRKADDDQSAKSAKK